MTDIFTAREVGVSRPMKTRSKSFVLLVCCRTSRVHALGAIHKTARSLPPERRCVQTRYLDLEKVRLVVSSDDDIGRRVAVSD